MFSDAWRMSNRFGRAPSLENIWNGYNKVSEFVEADTVLNVLQYKYDLCKLEQIE